MWPTNRSFVAPGGGGGGGSIFGHFAGGVELEVGLPNEPEREEEEADAETVEDAY